MSQFYDQSSLVFLPSGYRDGKLYSQKPLSTSGELSFSRASNATRVNSSGLVEKVRENLALYSEQFDNANWQKASSGTGVVPVVTANTTTAPDGTTTADTIVFNSGAGTTSSDYSTIYQLFSVSSATYTFSFYGKVASGTADIMLRLDSSQGYITKTLTTTWQRFDIEFTGASGFVEIGIRRGINEPIASSATVQLWGAMMELSDFGPTQYIATTTTAVSVGPVSGLPRLDYLGGASCPSLLLEPQRTNLALFSEQFDNAYWTKTATVTANSTISPSGYQDADTFTDASNSYLDVRRSFTITASTAYTFSIFVKKTTGTLTNYAGVGFSAGGGLETGYAIFNTTTGAVNLADVAGGFVLSAKSTSYGDYYRFEMTLTTGQTSLLVLIYPALSQNGTTLSSGAQGSNVFWGAQLEAGAYATSYIPTLSSAVTRVADAASKTGISSLIGQTEGTIFWEGNIKAVSETSRLIYLSDGTISNFINTYIDATNKIAATVRVSGSTVTSFESTAQTAGTIKVAFAYKANDCALYVNGVSISGTSGATVASTSRLDIGSRLGFDSFFNSGTSQALLFTSRLSNADLATLTSL